MGSVVAGQTDADHGEIGRGIVADDVSREALPIRERNINARGPMHDVAVGQYEPIGREHKSGAPALTLARFPRTASSGLRNINLDDRGADRFSGADDRLRVGVEQSCVVERTYF